MITCVTFSDFSVSSEMIPKQAKDNTVALVQSNCV